MSRAITCLLHHHDQAIVVLALLVCTVSSLSTFLQLQRARECVAARRPLWITSAAITAGGGVWSTHFISMIAFQSATSLGFGRLLTAMSATVAICAFAIAFARLARSRQPVVIGLSGAIATLGIAGMHLVGMAAVTSPQILGTSARSLSVASLLAWIALTGAFAAFTRCNGLKRIFLPAIALVVATIVIHFTAMSATTMSDHEAATAIANAGHAWLLAWIAAATLLLITLTAAASLIDRFLTDLRGFANATSEGLLISRDGKVIEVNEQACTLLGVQRAAILGTSAIEWFVIDQPVLSAAAKSEVSHAQVRGTAVPDQLIELSSRTIEYRGKASTVLAIRDLTEAARAQRAIEHLASHDPLTGLVNRAAFDLALREAVRSGGQFALLAVDLDRFKAVNDVFGHAAGDEVLERVAAILDKAVRAQDLVARVGGDEFIVLQRDISSTDDARRLASRIIAQFTEEMSPARDPMAVGCSLGVVTYPRDGTDPESLRHNADVALYRAKHSGRGTASFFDEEMDRAARDRRSLEHELRHAVCREELALVYQPLVSTASGQIAGYEALLRWRHPERGQVPPDIFIPVAEEAGTILALGEWVLRRACSEAATWPSHLTVAVNVSAVQLRVPALAEAVRLALHDTGLEPSRLELEITETALLRDRELTLQTLRQIRAMGVRISMDDFGTGYSSLSNLRHFPFDKLKIDKSFVSAMLDDDAARSIVRAIAGLGKGLNLPVVAEGVETEAQHKMVAEEGCPQAQGYYFGTALSKPVHVIPEPETASKRA